MKYLIAAALLIALPAFGEDFSDPGSGNLAIGSPLNVTTTFTVTANGNEFCPFATINQTGEVTINRACLDRAAARCHDGTHCTEWDAVARLVKAAMDRTYVETAK